MYRVPSCGEYWLSTGYVADISLYPVVQDMYRVPSCGKYWLNTGYVPDISLYPVVQDMYRASSCGGSRFCEGNVASTRASTVLH